MRELKPEKVWGYFEEILKIPRLSKHEEKIISYLETFARKNNLDFKKDKLGNCLILKPASKGYEDRQIIVLQSHLDMVGEKLLEVDHDFMKDPIISEQKDGWITAQGTTLGADDGIGIAASLAILEDNNLEHGPIECLFTVDEETGMTGALGIEEGFMQGKILLNLDSEDEGEIFIGCAGGIDTVGRFQKKLKNAPQGSKALKIVIDGLQGGHSGDEIHKGFANSIKLITRFLWKADKEISISIASLTGGNLRNAIPRDSEAVIVFPEHAETDLLDFIKDYHKQLAADLKRIEPGFKMTMTSVDLPPQVLERDFQSKFLNMLYACPHGVINWSQEIPGLVETSTNLAVVKESSDGCIEVITSQRSSNDFAKMLIADRMEALFTLAEGEVIHSQGYPGWEPDPDSAILKVAENAYRTLFHDKPQVKAIHAGLECGLFLEKYPGLDMISFGPTIKGAHTPEERINIESVTRFWDLLLLILLQAPEK